LVRQSKHNAIAAKLIVELACITQAVPVPFLSHEEGLVIIRDACSEALRGVYIVVGRRN
jgi:hypothetical protein